MFGDTGIHATIHVGVRIGDFEAFGHPCRMHSALFYVLSLTSLIVVAGSVIAFFAIRNAPEGYENEEGFVGLTKGDELLLSQFAEFRQAFVNQQANAA